MCNPANPAALPYNIVLCGFMGCGKSTVGRKLARMLSLSFIDMDAHIEQRSGMAISEIFAQFGEDRFRELEYEAAVELSGRTGQVIATGGGALIFERNVHALKRTGKIVLLDVTLNDVKRRLYADTTRPLLQRADRDKAMQELYEARLPLYRAAADYVISAGAPPKKVCDKILTELHLNTEPAEFSVRKG